MLATSKLTAEEAVQKLASDLCQGADRLLDALFGSNNEKLAEQISLQTALTLSSSLSFYETLHWFGATDSDIVVRAGGSQSKSLCTYPRQYRRYLSGCITDCMAKPSKHTPLRAQLCRCLRDNADFTDE